ncbi:MAG: LytR C-terminal domain-containing protein [Propioniciclava sp.]
MDPQTVLRAVKTPATLIVLLLFVYWVAQWSFKAATDPMPSAPPDPCVVKEIGDQLTPQHVYVRVFNGTEVSGLAKRLAATLRADGFNVYKTTNTDEPNSETSVVVGYAEDSPEVILVRQAFSDIAFRADNRPDRTVDVIIGTEGPNPINQPDFNAPLADGTACVPQLTLVDSEE